MPPAATVQLAGVLVAWGDAASVFGSLRVSFGLGLAPGLRRRWAMRCAADERHGQSFLDQDRPNVSSVRPKCPALSTVVAGECPLRAFRARTADVRELEPAGSDELAQATCRSSSE